MLELTISILNMSWQDWATVASVIFGFVTLIAYLDQRRGNKQNQVLVEFAKRHVEKDISEEQLSSLSSKRESIEQQIVQLLPVLARQAVLKEQRQHHAMAAAEHYSKVCLIDTEIGEAYANSTLDPTLAAAISKELLPEFEINRRRESLRSHVTVYSVAVALSSSLLPFPISELVVIFLAIPLSSAVLRLGVMEGTITISFRRARLFAYGVFAGLDISVAGLGIALIVDSYFKITGWIVIFFSAIIGVIIVFNRKLINSFLAKIGF